MNQENNFNKPPKHVSTTVYSDYPFVSKDILEEIVKNFIEEHGANYKYSTIEVEVNGIKFRFNSQ